MAKEKLDMTQEDILRHMYQHSQGYCMGLYKRIDEMTEDEIVRFQDFADIYINAMDAIIPKIREFEDTRGITEYEGDHYMLCEGLDVIAETYGKDIEFSESETDKFRTYHYSLNFENCTIYTMNFINKRG